MNKIEFDFGRARWDRFERFHMLEDAFLVFETGEVCFTQRAPDPDKRIHYAKYGITVFMPGDSHAPKLYTVEGAPVPAAQLELPNGGRPYLIWDHTTKVVKRISTYRSKQNPQVPAMLQTFAVYWAGEGAVPIASPIIVSPANIFTKEERAYVTACGDAATVTLKLLYSENILKTDAVIRSLTLPDIQIAMQDNVSPMTLTKACVPSLLQKLMTGAIATIDRTPITHEYLTVKEK